MSHQKPHRRLRLVHKRIALHASSIALLLGGTFLPMPFAAVGETGLINVSAKIPAPALTEPAIITDPSDQFRATTPTVTVTGNCPSDSYVIVRIGTTDAATAACDGNTFSGIITLNAGSNIITAHVFNITDDEGPQSQAITVYYDAPQPPAPSTVTSVPTAQHQQQNASLETATNATAPLSITGGSYQFTTKHPRDEWRWDCIISGGYAPYAISVDWGDSHLAFTQTDPKLTLVHTYTQTGIYQPLVRITDQKGTTVSLQLLAVVKQSASAGGFLAATNKPLEAISPWIAWPIYSVVVTSIGAFWAFELTALIKYTIRALRLRRGHA